MATRRQRAQSKPQEMDVEQPASTQSQPVTPNNSSSSSTEKPKKPQRLSEFYIALMDRKQFLPADLIVALEKAVIDGNYDGTREENKLLRKAYDLYVDGISAVLDDYNAALKVVIEKQAKREEKKNNAKAAPATPPAPKKRRTNSKKGGSDATTPYKATPASEDPAMTM